MDRPDHATADGGHRQETQAESAATSDILSSVGTATYEWAIPSDRLTWSENAATVLGVDPRARGLEHPQRSQQQPGAGKQYDR